MVNFTWVAIQILLRDLGLLIRNSAENMKLAPPIRPAVQANDKEAASQTIPLIERCVEVSEKKLARLKCAHINDATSPDISH
jgi:hypothetical protein